MMLLCLRNRLFNFFLEYSRFGNSTAFSKFLTLEILVPNLVRPTHTAPLATDPHIFPPVCDGLASCVLGRKKVNHNVFAPSTSALCPCEFARSVRPSKNISHQQGTSKRKENVTQFNYSTFFEEQLEKKRAAASYRVFRRILRDTNYFPLAKDFSTGRSQTVDLWCSNDYLGMSRHPMVLDSARNAINRFGVGSGGTRNISGNTLLHEALEYELADLHGKEAGLVFTSCFVANEATLYTLGAMIPGLKVFSDAGNHASIIHGIRTSRVPKYIYRENDIAQLDELMQSQSTPSAPKLAVCETVHSMNGDIVPLKEFLDVCEKHNALTFVDEVHAVGLYGEHGGGIAEQVGCMNRIDAITGTLGKAFGSIGGYLVGNKALVDTVRSYASGLIFTTSLPPVVLAAARASIAILKSAEGRQLRERHRRSTQLVRRRLQEAGLPVASVPSHIIPICVGNAEVCTNISEELLRNHQIYIQSINYPTVAQGTERLRLAPSPFHTDEMISHLVESLIKVWRSHNLPLKQTKSLIKN